MCHGMFAMVREQSCGFSFFFFFFFFFKKRTELGWGGVGEGSSVIKFRLSGLGFT